MAKGVRHDGQDARPPYCYKSYRYCTGMSSPSCIFTAIKLLIALRRRYQPVFCRPDLLRYDDGMNLRHLTRLKTRRYVAAALVAAAAMLLGGCRSREGAEAPVEPAGAEEQTFEGTSDPALSQTMQAEAALTAAWVAEQSIPPTATDEPFPTLAATAALGTPVSSLTGQCDIPGDYELHLRDTFCLGAPPEWKPLNIDGGLAASLSTTPAQAIGLQPDWAAAADSCSLLIYITTGDSAEAHLQTTYNSFVNRADLVELSAVQAQTLGDLMAPGFTWVSSGGESGGVYADVVGMNRVVRISYRGTECQLDDLLPVLSTLRFNMSQP